MRRNITGGIEIEEMPKSKPQTAISERDRAGGIYLIPINQAPDNGEITARVDSKRKTVTSIE